MDSTQKLTNSKEYWDIRFESLDWEKKEGKKQTLFFGNLTLENLPDWFLTYVKNKKLSICDFGCALGQITQLFAINFPDSYVLGQDISASAIKIAKDSYPAINFTHENLLTSQNEYDIIFSSNTLEHFYNPKDIINQLSARARKFLVFLLPFYDDLIIDEHFYSFTYDNIPITIKDKFDLVYYKEINTANIPNTSWYGKQILVIYTISSIADELEHLSQELVLLKKSKTDYRLALIESILKKEAQQKMLDHLAFPIKQELEQALAQQQAQQQTIAQELEQTLTHRDELENSLAIEREVHQSALKQLEQALLQKQAAHLEQALAQQQAQYQTIARELEQTLTHKDELENSLAMEREVHQSALKQLEQALLQEQASHQALKQQLNYVYNSVSWKSTTILRKIYRWLPFSPHALFKTILSKFHYSAYKIFKKLPYRYQKPLKKIIFKVVYLDPPKVIQQATLPKFQGNDSANIFIHSMLDTVKNKNLVICVQPTFYTLDATNCYNGGAERYIIDLSEIFLKNNYTFWIIQLSANNCWLRLYNGIPVIGLPGFVQREEFYYYLNHFCEKANLVIASPFTFASQIHASNIIGISHGVFWDHPSFNHDGFKTELQQALNKLDHLISVDTNSINVIRTLGNQSVMDKITYVPNYFDFDRHYNIDDFPLNLPENKTVILFPRRLQDARGFYLMMELLPSIFKQLDSIIFVFVGYGEDQETKTMKEACNRYKGKVFHTVAEPDDMMVFYEKSDIVLIPTLFSEGTSLSCIEAMANKKAIIATCVGGLTDLIINEYSGLLINPNVEDLFKAIIRLVEDKPFREYLANNAFEQAKTFNKRRWKEQWENVIKAVPGFTFTGQSQFKSLVPIVHPSTLPYDKMKQRPQHLLMALSKMGFPCLYLDTINHKEPLVPAENFYILDKDSYINYSHYCVYAYYPYQVNSFKENKPALLVYDVLDAPDIHGTKEAIVCHQQMLEQADIIITSSKILFDEYKSYFKNKPVKYIPNAADPIFFKTSIQVSTPADFPTFRERTIGYYGAIAEWFDYNLLDEICTEITEEQIVLIGPFRKHFPEEAQLNRLLKKHPHLFHLGIKKYEELPAYAKNFDVAIIPFVDNEITRNCSPVKLFEYMNFGFPIVTSNMPECLNYQSAMVAKDNREFINLIKKALYLKSSDPYFDSMKKEAQENTWEARAKILIEAINENINAK